MLLSGNSRSCFGFRLALSGLAERLESLGRRKNMNQLLRNTFCSKCPQTQCSGKEQAITISNIKHSSDCSEKRTGLSHHSQPPNSILDGFLVSLVVGRTLFCHSLPVLSKELPSATSYASHEEHSDTDEYCFSKKT